MSDINMFQFIEKGTRGGIMHRYGKANNKQMQNYVEELVIKYIMYLHAKGRNQQSRPEWVPWKQQGGIDPGGGAGVPARITRPPQRIPTSARQAAGHQRDAVTLLPGVEEEV